MYKKTAGILAVFFALSIISGCHHGHDANEPIALGLPQGTPKPPQGSGALTVHPGAPQPFTKQDVIDYFKTHNLPKNGGDLTQINVSTLEFLTSKEVSQRLQGEPTGLEDNERIGFVTLTGDFIFTGPSGKTARFTQAYAAFSATTGNLLMIGTLSQTDNAPR